MSNWQQVLGKMVVNVEDYFDQLKYRLRERIGHRPPIMIRPYRGFGTQERLYLKGRVLEDRGIVLAEDNDSLWENLVNMYKRFESDEIPHARVRWRFQGVEQEVVTDEEGYFEVWIEPVQPLPEDRWWHSVDLELVAPLRENELPARAEGQVFVPLPGCQFGVISDIDDTVLQTNAAHLLRMARTVFLGNARTRLPFKGVGAFYRALFSGASMASPAAGTAAAGDVQPGPANPLFYISSSPWNLYGLLSEFFNLQNIPIGPILMLRDWGISESEFLPTGHRSHKLQSIEKVMGLYRDLPFILIGDSGQEDPEIYAEAVGEYPRRILAIYIRNVSRDLKRPEAIRELAKRVTEAGSTLILVDDTLPLAEHAAQQGWISPQALEEIRAEKEADEAPLNPVEKLLGVEEQPSRAPTVVVPAGQPEQVQAAVDEGLIEKALEIGEAETKKPPTVVVEGDEAKQPDAE
jgi:phosphatidate phosphatase APP1